MSTLYRTAVLVRRKQPYIDWANGACGDDVSFPLEFASARDVYLGPYSETAKTAAEVLDEIWEDIFEEELSAWHLDEARWPADRTRVLFDQWFENELVDSIVDLVPDDPLTESDAELDALDHTLQTCAWCGAELGPGPPRMATFALPPEDRLDEREGHVLTLTMSGTRAVTGVVTERDSQPAAEGTDLFFCASSHRCQKRLEVGVPPALEELLKWRAAQSSKRT